MIYHICDILTLECLSYFIIKFYVKILRYPELLFKAENVLDEIVDCITRSWTLFMNLFYLRPFYKIFHFQILNWHEMLLWQGLMNEYFSRLLFLRIFRALWSYDTVLLTSHGDLLVTCQAISYPVSITHTGLGHQTFIVQMGCWQASRPYGENGSRFPGGWLSPHQ